MKNEFLYMSKQAAAFGIFCCSLFVSTASNGQTKHPSAGNVKIVIEGTSNIHDWEMKSDKGTCTAVLDLNNSGALTGISAINFSVSAISLKSDHNGMDKNSYKALNTGKFAEIHFVGQSGDIKQVGNAAYILTTKGKLTISGVTKEIVLTANGVLNQDKSITYSGSYPIKMTDYSVEPPSLMFGAIKTGNNVVVKFNLVLKTI